MLLSIRIEYTMAPIQMAMFNVESVGMYRKMAEEDTSMRDWGAYKHS